VPLDDFWQLDAEAAYSTVDSRPAGLSQAEAASRLARFGPNRIEGARRGATLLLLARQFQSPPILILTAATIGSGLLGDAFSSTLILGMILASGFLGFWQERGAMRAVDALRQVVQVQAEVLRDGQMVTLPIERIVPGDVVVLNAGDLVPADGLVIESRSLLVEESALTGESFPVEKSPRWADGTPIGSRQNAVFLGTHVASGSGRALMMRTGRATAFGRISASLGGPRVTTSFERGMTRFGVLLARLTALLVISIFAVNIALDRPVIDSVLFSLALAVGLTPEMLPAIVAISLSQGARRMARRRVIVKRLDAIEDIGAMTVLCTDKTGTMTVGAVRFEGAVGLDGAANPVAARLALLNATLQTGFTNPIDAAIAATADPPARTPPVPSNALTSASKTTVSESSIPLPRLVDELPYDFHRRRLSVLVEEDGRVSLITKGAVESVLAACATVERPDGQTTDLDADRDRIRARFEALSAAGYRVLGIASRDVPGGSRLDPADEAGLTFRGFLLFLDPPREDASAVIRELERVGVSVRMITGDNRLAAAEVGRRVGVVSPGLLSGAEIARLDDEELVKAARTVGIFAEVDPAQKERIIGALQTSGEVVGYLGDGINDAPALHAADVGISVDTAVDVAKASAAIVLLEKDLGVLLDGVLQGRRTFTNTLKYVFTTMSANFGNMVSVALVAGILPFLPLLATQILLVNFLTDFPSTTVATDEVDPEQLDRPQRWDVERLQAFLLRFGALSSVFDLLTFAVLRLGFEAGETLFRSGWFLESVATEIVVLLALRTARPFYQSRPGGLLLASTLAVGVLTVGLIYSPLAPLLGLVALPLDVVLALVGITLLYVVATELAKRRYYRGPADAAAGGAARHAGPAAADRQESTWPGRSG
jgi:Mg2+-importing ATPase